MNPPPPIEDSVNQISPVRGWPSASYPGSMSTMTLSGSCSGQICRAAASVACPIVESVRSRSHRLNAAGSGAQYCGARASRRATIAGFLSASLSRAPMRDSAADSDSIDARSS